MMHDLFVKHKKYTRLILISGFIIITDQIVKMIILKTMPLYQSIKVVPGFFNITHIHNRGGAFGMFADQSPTFRIIVFLIVSMFAVCVIFWLYRNTPDTHRFLSIALAMIFGGAIGNLIDRVRFGEVIDFLDFYLGSWHWPAFNVADSAITMGVIIFAFHLLFNKLPE